MSKKLTPLEAWKLIDKSGTMETLCITETALKRLEEHDKIFKKYDIDDDWLEASLYVIKNHFPMDTKTQLKKLKALEIIKEKRVNVETLTDILEEEWTWEQYMDEENDRNTGGHQFSRDRLTQDEYDLLKKVLK